MTARQPRRRRRAVPAASTLARPVPGMADAPLSSLRGAARRHATRPREHHVTNDYSYVHKDLLTIAVVGVIVVAFILGMSFLV
jgi:hypothetical protein